MRKNQRWIPSIKFAEKKRQWNGLGLYERSAETIAKGYRLDVIQQLENITTISSVEFCRYTKISKERISTHRANKEGFTQQESDVIYRLASICATAIDCFQDPEIAINWLRTQQADLNNKAPLDTLLITKEYEETKNLMHRIKYDGYF